MFQINIDSHRRTLSELQELEQTMVTEREKQLDIVANMSYGWAGKSAVLFTKMQSQMLEKGLYETTYQQVKGMRTTMEETLPKLVCMKCRCNTFYTCLYGNAALTNGYADGNVKLNKSYIAKIDKACSNVKYSHQKVYIELQSIMRACSGIVDFGKCADRLAKANQKVLQIDNLKTEIDLYAKDIQELDYHLQREYAQYIDQQFLDSVKDIEETAMNKKLADLKSELDAKGLTLEQYRAAVLDALMYLDFFEAADSGEVEVRELDNIKTINELITYLGKYEIYKGPSEDDEDDGDTRYIYYQILVDAVKKDPSLGDFEIQFMSRLMEGKNYNSGTNAITFIDPYSDAVYVAFRGTSTGEWGDDGRRFSVKGMDSLTPQMEQVLDYIQTVATEMNWNEDMHIITTGHSQGGNDAQVVTLFSDFGHYVDQCFSFDGEGHSPDLIEEAKAYMNKKYGEGEYESRISKMFSICGEYDFVNHLGEKVISEDNTIYIHCEYAKSDVARLHDIVSMFCVKEGDTYTYSGTINTAKGTGSSWVTELTANLWDELCKMPDDMRYSCQETIMTLAERYVANNKKGGLNGEKATIRDKINFYAYGLLAIGKAVVDTEEIDIDAVKACCSDAIKKCVAEEICKLTEFASEQQTKLLEAISITLLGSVAYYGSQFLEGDYSYQKSVEYLLGEQAFDYAVRAGERGLDSFTEFIEVIQEEKQNACDRVQMVGELIQDIGAHIWENKEEVFKIMLPPVVPIPVLP